MARRPSKRATPKTLGPTPERLAKADGHLVSVPTEHAGTNTNKLVPTWERLLGRGTITNRQAVAAAKYIVAWERLESAGYAPSILLKAGAKVDVSFTSGDMPEEVIRTAAGFRRVCDVLGADWFLVDAVCRLDLHPAKGWHKSRLRAALDRLADVVGA